MQPKPPPKYRILVMMATNMPDSLDPTFLRPGRIDRMYHVNYPAKAGRIRTYEGYLAKVKHELTPEQVDRLAVMTPYATGATIKDLVNEALIQAIEDDRDTVTWQDILRAKHLKSLGPSRDVELVGQDRHGVAVHEACHAFVAYHVRNHLEIDLATIEPGNGYLGMISSIKIDDRFKQFKSEHEADVMVALASLAGERMFFAGDSASGVSGDLEQATQVAILMEGYWGMGSTIASHAITNPAGIEGGSPGNLRGEADKTMLHAQLGDRIEKNLDRLMEATTKLLESDREGILCLAHALEQNITIPGEDVAAVLDRRQGSMVDGRQYADKAFVQQIVDYHEQMLAEHQRGLNNDIDVPKRELVSVGAAAATATGRDSRPCSSTRTARRSSAPASAAARLPHRPTATRRRTATGNRTRTKPRSDRLGAHPGRDRGTRMYATTRADAKATVESPIPVSRVRESQPTTLAMNW